MIEPGYEACIFGELVFPGSADVAREAHARWRATRLDPDAIEDWPEAFQHGRRPRGSVTGRDEDEDERPTIGQWLDDCARYERSGTRHFLEFGEESQSVRVRGFLEEDDFDAYRRQLVTMFRLASAVGARGNLTLVSKPWHRFVLGYRVEVKPGGSRLDELTEDDVARLDDRSALDEIVARVKESPTERAFSETRASLPRL